MKTVQEYLGRAEQCDELAKEAISAEQREQIQHIADMWRSLAKDREKLILTTTKGDRTPNAGPNPKPSLHG